MSGRTAKLGEALRALRKRRGDSLADVSQQTGISISALSKVENGRLSLTYDKLMMLSEGLDVDINYFFSGADADGDKPGQPTGRRSIDRSEDGRLVETRNYSHRYLGTEISNKKMVPLIVDIKARTMEEFGEFVRHHGEEFIYVLQGTLIVHTEFYEPVVLEEGESLYIDSMMGHAYLSGGEGPCRTVAVCTAPEAQLTEAVEKATAERKPARTE